MPSAIAAMRRNCGSMPDEAVPSNERQDAELLVEVLRHAPDAVAVVDGAQPGGGRILYSNSTLGAASAAAGRVAGRPQAGRDRDQRFAGARPKSAAHRCRWSARTGRGSAASVSNHGSRATAGWCFTGRCPSSHSKRTQAVAQSGGSQRSRDPRAPDGGIAPRLVDRAARFAPDYRDALRPRRLSHLHRDIRPHGGRQRAAPGGQDDRRRDAANERCRRAIRRRRVRRARRVDGAAERSLSRGDRSSAGSARSRFITRARRRAVTSR